MRTLSGARACGDELLARLLGVGGLIALSTALVAGCVNVYVQPAPTATFALWQPYPNFPIATARPRPRPTPVSSFTFSGTGPGGVSAALGNRPYLVTLTVTGGGCGIVFESMDRASLREGHPISLPGFPGGIPGQPDLEVAPKSDWLWVAAELGGHTKRSASAVLQYEEPDVDSMDWVRWPVVSIRVDGDCPSWEIRGERKG